MPDTMLPTTTAASVSAPAGFVSDYRSPMIGQLVAARAKATKEIKTIIKDKKATIPNKNGGNGYQYSYADLADIMDAVDDALAAQEIAIFQTLQERGGKPVLVTTLAHSSDQWVSSELKVSSIDAGPQVFGSALTYARRYSVLAILGLAPDTDDDGRAAQERADQQARAKPAQRVETPRSDNPPTESRRSHPAGSRRLWRACAYASLHGQGWTAGQPLDQGCAGSASRQANRVAVCVACPASRGNGRGS